MGSYHVSVAVSDKWLSITLQGIYIYIYSIIKQTEESYLPTMTQDVFDGANSRSNFSTNTTAKITSCSISTIIKLLSLNMPSLSLMNHDENHMIHHAHAA